MYRLWCSTLIQTPPSIFWILSQHIIQAQYIDQYIWIVIIKALHINGVNNFTLFYDDKPNTLSHQWQLIVRYGKYTLVSKQLSTLTLQRKQELKGQLKLGKLVVPRPYSSSPFWYHRKGWGGQKLKFGVDAITTKAVIQEVTTIHSSISYNNDIGHPSHAQINDTCNKQSYSINALTIQK